MATAFSSDGAEVIQRTLITTEAGGRLPVCGIEDFYELERAVAFVSDNGFTKVSYFVTCQFSSGFGYTLLHLTRKTIQLQCNVDRN